MNNARCSFVRKFRNLALVCAGILSLSAIADIEPPLDTELNDLPGDLKVGLYVQEIAESMISDNVTLTNGVLIVRSEALDLYEMTNLTYKAAVDAAAAMTNGLNVEVGVEIAGATNKLWDASTNYVQGVVSNKVDAVDFNAATNELVVAVAGKQDKLPYPTNSIPQGAVSGLSTALDGKVEKSDFNTATNLFVKKSGDAMTGSLSTPSLTVPDISEGDIKIENGKIKHYDWGYLGWRTYSLPDESGTFALKSDISSQVAAAATASTNYTDAATNTLNQTINSNLASNYYTIAQTDKAIDAMAAYYITADAQGNAFTNYVSLTNTTVYYSGGIVRTPTRNDYAVVLADEMHGGAEWRYIYAVPNGSTNGQWEAQYPIETNDYDGLSNKPQINGVSLTGNKTGADLGVLDLSGGTINGTITFADLNQGALTIGNGVIKHFDWGALETFIYHLPLDTGTLALTSDIDAAISPTSPAFSNAVLSVGLGIDTNTVAAINALVEQGEELPIGSATTVGALLLALAAAVVSLRRAKVNSTSVAPDFSNEATYAVGDYVTYLGVLYKCVVAKTAPSSTTPDNDIYNETTAPTNHWIVTDTTSPDAMLDITSTGSLRIVGANGSVLWQQGYKLASASSGTIANDAVNIFSFAPVASFDDTANYAVGDTVAYNGIAYTFTLAHGAGAWTGTDAVVAEQVFSLPIVPSGRVGDFVLELDNTANPSVSYGIAISQYSALTVEFVIPAGLNLDDMFTIVGGERSELHFTQTAFAVSGKPTWKVVRQDLEVA